MRIIVFLAFMSATVFAQDSLRVKTDSLEQVYRPGDHELFLMPTAYTMPENGSYFSDYELFLLNYTYGATPRTHIGAMTIFPVTTEFLETFTLGLKQNYYKSEEFNAAFWGTYTIKNGLYTLGNVFSIGKKSRSLHAGIALAGEIKSDNSEIFYFFGGRLDLSKSVAAIAEFSSSNALLTDNGIKGIFTIGIRFIGEKVAWEVAGIRPGSDTGKLLFLPYLKATFYF